MSQHNRYTMKAAAARAHAKVGKKNDVGMCLAECINPDYDSPYSIPRPWGWGGNGKAWAINYWLYAVAHGLVVKTSDPSKVPAGALGFMIKNSDIGRAKPLAAGHVFVGAGKSHAYSTDRPKKGVWGNVSIQSIEQGWGMTLVGYILITGDGYILTDKPTAPTTALWGKPDTFKLGSVGPDVVRLGERAIVHLQALGLKVPYKVGPSSPLSEVDVKAVETLQRAWGWTGADADGYPGAETFKRLAAAPAPQVKKIIAKTSTQNLAGNNAYGLRTGVTRTKKYVATRKATPVDVLGVQETTVASRIRSTLDAGLKGVMRRVGGGKGRYSYASPRVHVTEAGLITVAKKYWFQNDDKQASYVAGIIDGARHLDVNLHLESKLGAAADEKRLQQALNIVAQAVAIAARLNIPLANVIFSGDFNSNKAVVEALAKVGWVNAAAGTKFEDLPTFIGWDGKSTDRFDYFLVHTTCKRAAVVALNADTGIADHAGLRCERELVA